MMEKTTGIRGRPGKYRW